jgi:4-amino-4-deoxy-L-arabinose transferase-like glycosyltransferase
MLYLLVRRHFGTNAGLLAALFMALTPIVVAMDRDNNLDMLLVFTLLIAAWFMTLAAETGRLRWLLLGFFVVALGFNIKTLEAYLALPALALLYFLCAPLSWKKRLLHLTLATVLLLVVSFSWIFAVDLTPASQRPYVDSSQTNSELELTLGYNGIERLVGISFGGQRRASTTSDNSTPASSTPPANVDLPTGGGGGGGIFNEGGPPSLFRLFNADLGGQVSWLLPLALIGMLALLWQSRFRWPLNFRWQAAILWGVWLLTTGIFFSVASFFHSYYLVMVAPAVCALAAIGLVVLWKNYRELSDWRGWVLPIALVLTAAEQAYLLTAYGSDYTPLLLVELIVCILAAAVLTIARLRPTLRITPRMLLLPAVIVGMVALLLTPALWSFISISQTLNETLPTGGPALAGGGAFAFGGRGQRTGIGDLPGVAELAGFAGGRGGGGNGGNDFTSQVNQKLISYLEAHQGNSRFLVATLNSMSAEPIIIQTGKPVMSMGGFIGSDPILTQASLASLVQNGTVRFFLLQSGRGGFNIDSILEDLPPATREQLEEQFGGGGAGFGAFGGGQSDLTSWIQAHCSVVSAQLWQNIDQSSTGSTGGGLSQGQNLYDCSQRH